jgi:hypothetical protein
MDSKSLSIRDDIIKPNKHPIDNNKLIAFLSRADPSIKSIAAEFIMKTQYIPYNLFVKTLRACFTEIVAKVKNTTLQFYLPKDDKDYFHKSGYWILQHIKTFVNSKKYDFIVIDDIRKINTSIPIIIADDASYSGTQLTSYIESFVGMNCDIYILVPFISNTAIDVITQGFHEFNINGDIYFANKSNIIMKPIYESMEEKKVEQLFAYYTKDGQNIREYPYYFDHKVADNYSSFPLIYTYGVIPNAHNKAIIQDCKKNRVALKDHFHKLEREALLKNCVTDIIYDISKPACPTQPYKVDFHAIKRTSSTTRKSTKSNKTV